MAVLRYFTTRVYSIFDGFWLSLVVLAIHDREWVAMVVAALLGSLISAILERFAKEQPFAWYVDCQQPDTGMHYRSFTDHPPSVTSLHKPLYRASEDK